ncbi:family transcriptional regulator [Leptolyngbya sp. Heron Island J]|uniref:dienelactone hydrolase family protein n=1 Tax=Leptolyngbya sp. Heron Island J TaxID=1385935 RepID=UPI0003B9C117|nr:dienelactone hydrolase family protein [Leptolyngbya sp. Heron Island J]ESA36649.1 family transcriptional regulator [Leptolyngbya sp. Heron Island J]
MGTLTKIKNKNNHEHLVAVQAGSVTLSGNLVIPTGAQGIVLFAHGSGSSRLSPRNRYVAKVLNDAGLGTLLFDLLTSREESIDRHSLHLRFDIGLLASRLKGATDWIAQHAKTHRLNIGYFGASTGSAAALIAAAEKPDMISVIVSRGGRPDLAGTALTRVQTPTLLIVGGNDPMVIDLNQDAFAKISAEKHLEIVPGATHLFEESGALEQVAQLASQWFQKHLNAANTAS